MQHSVIIETSPREDGGYFAHIVDGPKWAEGWCATGDAREEAAFALRRDLQWERPRDTFQFIHARS